MMKKYILFVFAFQLTVSAFGQDTENIHWWSPSHQENHVISSQGWPNEVESMYHRLPTRVEEKLRTPVWHLSKQSAGLSIRFWTNAKNILVKYRVNGAIEMPHMPATGVSGVDLYSKSYHGDWSRCWGTYSISEESNYNFIIENETDAYTKHGTEYQLFLPLYNEVESLEIGVDEKSFFTVQPLRREKPIVAYGTSICQGACASRPGMAWTNILERALDRPVINLGFSGNGRLEPEVIHLLTEIDAKLYILDCLPNLDPQKDDTYQLTIDAVKKLKEKRPHTPIILTDHLGYADSSNNANKNNSYRALNKALHRAYIQLKSKGYTDIFLMKQEDLGLEYDSFVDAIHPNDVGMQEYAEAYETLIRRILKESIGTISTTIPKTQSRDINIYKWEDRHQAILELNKTQPPKICLFGNSITHFWGGLPTAKISRGQNSWDAVMKSNGVRNFGIGWDRIENVLWRIHHDALDGYEAEKIMFMIGTNNLHLNTDSEIIEGIEELIYATRIRQPNADILLLGILPRTGKEMRVKNLNLKISEVANLENVDYADIGKDLVLENETLNETLFTDGLHPNEKGYEIMAREFQRLLSNSR